MNTLQIDVICNEQNMMSPEKRKEWESKMIQRKAAWKKQEEEEQKQKEEQKNEPVNPYQQNEGE